MSKVVRRDLYLNMFLRFKDRPFVKVITGIRRRGKSTIMDMFTDHLIRTGVPPEKILYIRFDLPGNLEINDHRRLMEEVEGRIIILSAFR